MSKAKFKVGDEVIALDGRRWLDADERQGVIGEVHARGVYLRGGHTFLDKRSIAHRGPEAEHLASLMDLFARLEKEFDEQREAAIAPVREKYAKVLLPLREEIETLWRTLRA